MTKKILFLGICIAVLAGSLAGVGARQGAAAAVPIDADDIGGVVTSAKGPEAGVWVIAETRDLPTKLSRERRDRRQGPVRDPGSAEGELPGVRARVWTRGLAESHSYAGQAPESESGRGAQSDARRPRSTRPRTGSP